MNKTLVINYEEFEEENMKVMSVIDQDTDTVVEMFTGDEAVYILKKLMGEEFA